VELWVPTRSRRVPRRTRCAEGMRGHFTTFCYSTQESRRPRRHNVGTTPTRRTHEEAEAERQRTPGGQRSPEVVDVSEDQDSGDERSPEAVDQCESDGDFDKVVAPPTQTHRGLPIRSWMKAPGTPHDQIVEFMSEDLTRAHDTLAEIRKWRVFLEGLRDNPIDLAALLNDDGWQKVTWWRRFFENGAGVFIADVKTRQ
jgi:hypothetical protein